ncbi:MAG: hypothetical protein Q6L19_07465 [Gloeomargarita sp. GMQP_bins_69]
MNPEQMGTKACVHYSMDVLAEGLVQVLLPLRDQPGLFHLEQGSALFDQRRREADELYDMVISPTIPDD